MPQVWGLARLQQDTYGLAKPLDGCSILKDLESGRKRTVACNQKLSFRYVSRCNIFAGRDGAYS